jgi:hypothetical protein
LVGESLKRTPRAAALMIQVIVGGAQFEQGSDQRRESCSRDGMCGGATTRESHPLETLLLSYRNRHKTKRSTEEQRHSLLASCPCCRRLPCCVTVESALGTEGTSIRSTRVRVATLMHAICIDMGSTGASVRSHFEPHVSPVTFFFPPPLPASSSSSAHCLATIWEQP